MYHNNAFFGNMLNRRVPQWASSACPQLYAFIGLLLPPLGKVTWEHIDDKQSEEQSNVVPTSLNSLVLVDNIYSVDKKLGSASILQPRERCRMFCTVKSKSDYLINIYIIQIDYTVTLKYYVIHQIFYTTAQKGDFVPSSSSHRIGVPQNGLQTAIWIYLL